MSHNWIMLETAQAKELAVAEAADLLVGIDSSYCPLYYDLRRTSRRAQWRGGSIKANPVLPRLVFITASYPDLTAVAAIRGVESIIRNPYGVPEVVPGWQMELFKVEIEKRRQWCLKMAAKGIKEAKRPPKFKSFAEVQAFLAKSGEVADAETGEIGPLDISVAA